jgi:pilus assembly protein CpaF
MATLPPDQLRIIRAKLITNSGQPTIENIVSVLRETIPTITKAELISNADTILANTSGLGLIDELVQTPNVTDVLVNGFADIWFDRGNGLEKSSVAWNSETELREFAARLAASVNRRLDDVNHLLMPNYQMEFAFTRSSHHFQGKAPYFRFGFQHDTKCGLTN